MSKLHRFIEENAGYHVVSTTHWRAPVFRDAENAVVVVDALQHIRGRCYLLAYAVMPDHVHAVIFPKANRAISSLMQSLKGYSSRRINLLSGRRGPLWQQSFFDRMIRNERELFETINYIDMNPVVAGLVVQPEDYEFSSALRPELTDLDAFYTDDPIDRETAEAGKPRLPVVAAGVARARRR